jgi:predicted O-methyltransferase YrrM
MDRSTPWLVQGAVDFIDYHIRKNSNIFEFGSGASTRWFRIRSKRVISVEHNEEYAHPGIIFHPLPYHEYILIYPDNYFDFILIDGRNRNDCLRTSINKIKKGKYIILDNSERDTYQKAITTYVNGWNRFIFYQNRPDVYGFCYPGWQTTIFQKP